MYHHLFLKKAQKIEEAAKLQEEDFQNLKFSY
jgi:hypothetical protein